MSLSTLTKQVTKNVTKNSPTILTIMGVAGVIGTAVLSVRATPKALRIIEHERSKHRYEIKNNEALKPINNMDIIKATWKEYIPTFLMGSATITCIVGANSINLRRVALLQGVYSLTQSAFNEYQSKVVKLLGEKADRQVKDDIAEDKIKQNPVSNNIVYMTTAGNTLCYDTFSGRYFRSDIETLRKIENSFNKTLRTEMWLDLNELYSEMGLEPTGLGDQVGWDVDVMMEFIFTSKLADNGEPCLVVSHQNLPEPKQVYA